VFLSLSQPCFSSSSSSFYVGLRPGKNVFTMREIDELGMAEAMRRALYQIAPAGGPFALSLDIDGLDPSEAPGVGTPVPGGVSYREAHLAMEMISDHGNVQAMDLVEVNPILDRSNQTARLGVELVCSVLGKSILVTQRELARK
jgi:arginase